MVFSQFGNRSIELNSELVVRVGTCTKPVMKMQLVKSSIALYIRFL